MFRWQPTKSMPRHSNVHDRPVRTGRLGGVQRTVRQQRPPVPHCGLLLLRPCEWSDPDQQSNTDVASRMWNHLSRHPAAVPVSAASCVLRQRQPSSMCQRRPFPGRQPSLLRQPSPGHHTGLQPAGQRGRVGGGRVGRSDGGSEAFLRPQCDRLRPRQQCRYPDRSCGCGRCWPDISMRKLELVAMLGDLRLWHADPPNRLLFLHDSQRSNAGLDENSRGPGSMWLNMWRWQHGITASLHCCSLRCDQQHVPV